MSVEIKARCHPQLEAALPKPVPAREALPAWLREMPSEAISPALGGSTVRTLKHCPPLIDALSMGIVLPLACDITAEGGEIAWDWEMPRLADHSASRAPIGMHVPEQASGAPIGGDWLFVKFTNYWTLEVPEGWQILFTHPLNRPDLPFHTLSGLVDCDKFGRGYVHFPALWRDPAWEGTLKAGTPIVQAIPVPRGKAKLTTQAMSEADIVATEEIQQLLKAEQGVYRKRFRLTA